MDKVEEVAVLREVALSSTIHLNDPRKNQVEDGANRPRRMARMWRDARKGLSGRRIEGQQRNLAQKLQQTLDRRMEEGSCEARMVLDLMLPETH